MPARLVCAVMVIAAVGMTSPTFAEDDPFALEDWLTQQAIFSCEQLVIKEWSIVDSAGDAGLGADEGHVISNEELILDVEAEIHGDATAGPGYDVEIKDGAFVTGAVGSLPSSRDCVPLDLGPLEAMLSSSNDNHLIPDTSNGNNPLQGEDFYLNDEELTLPEGRYVFSSFKVLDGAILRTNGQVDILVTSSSEIAAGAQVNPDATPTDFRLWSRSALVIKENSSFKGFVYAPEGDVQLADSVIFTGALFARKTLLQKYIEFHRASTEQLSIEVSSPAPGTPVSLCTVETSGIITGAPPIEFLVNGVLVPVADDGAFLARVPSTSNGDAKLLYEASNASGETSFELPLTAAPIPPLISSPADGALLNTASILVTGALGSATSITVNNIPAAIIDDIFSVNVSLGEGMQSITAAADSCFGPLTTSITVDVDTAAPVITIDLPAPGEGQCLEAGEIQTLAGAIFEAHPSPGTEGHPTALAITIVTSDGATTSHIGVIAADGRSWSLPNVSLGASDGMATASLIATDIVGNTSRTSRTWRLDGEIPTITLTLDGAPFPGAAPGQTPPAGTEPHLFGRIVSARASVSDGAYGAPPSPVLVLDSAPYAQGTAITAEGEHLLVATATDCAGHSASMHAYFTIDLSAPNLLSTDPADQANLTDGPLNFSGVADTELATATVNGVNATVSGTSFALNPVDWSEGTNHIRIELSDPAGNTAQYETTFIVRTVEPTIEILVSGLPIPVDALFTRALTPELRSNDDAATISVTLNGAGYFPGTIIDTSGDYTLIATVVDDLDRSATATAAFRIDLSDGPGITIAAPLDGDVLTETTVTVIGTVTGNNISVDVNSVPAVISTSGTDTIWTVTDLALDPDELNYLHATVTDDAGRRATTTITVMVHTGGPQIFIISPADGASTNRRLTDVEGLVVGGFDISANGEVVVNDQSVILSAEGAFTATDIPLNDGPNTITASVVDPQERPGRHEITVISDTSPPSVSVRVDGRRIEDGEAFTQPFDLEIVLSDNIPGPPPPVIRLNGQEQAADPATTIIPINEDGGYLLSIVATDAADNQIRIERSFILDQGGCSLSAIDPPNGTSVADASFTIRGDGGHAENIRVRVPVPGSDPLEYQDYAAQIADGTFSVGDVPLPVLGANTLLIACTGPSGDTAEQTHLIVRLNEGDAPIVDITYPATGAKTDQYSTTITGTVSDPSATLTINKLNTDLSEQSGQGIFDLTLNLSEGPNIVKAQAVDENGRAGSDRIIIWRDTKKPAIVISSPDDHAHIGPVTGFPPRVEISGFVDIDDENDLSIIWVSTNQGAITLPVSPDTGVFTGTVDLDATLFAEDPQTITVTATDELGNNNEVSVDIYLDPQGPSIIIDTPVDLQRFTEASATTLTITGHAWGADGARVSINGATLDPIHDLEWSAPLADGRMMTAFSTSIERPLDDSTFGIVARVTNLDGSYAQVRRTLFMDQTTPEVIEMIPADEASEVDPDSLLFVLFSEPMLHASLRASDGLTLRRLETNEIVAGEIAIAGTAVAFVPGVGLAPGERYRLRAGDSVTDVAGHALSTPYEVEFEVSAVTLGMAPALDALPEVICATKLAVRGIVSPNATVKIRDLDIVFTGFADATGAFEIIIPLTGNGYHLLSVYTVDATGSKSPSATALVRLDCSRPTVVTTSFDRLSAIISVEMSEDIDPSSAAIPASIRLFDNDDPSDTEQQANAVVHGQRINIELDTAADAWWRDRDVRLELSEPLADIRGNFISAPYSTIFSINGDSGDSGGYLFGEVFNDHTGRPVEGASISLYPSDAALPGAVGEATGAIVTTTSDDRGRFRMSGDIDTGRYALLISHPGMITVSRRIALDATTPTRPFDSRLTPLAADAGLLDIVSGGRFEYPDDPLIESPIELIELIAVDFAPNALAHGEAVTICLTALSPQALPDLLPLGWTPLNSVNLRLENDDIALPESTNFVTGRVFLEVPLPAWALPTDALIAVQHSLATGLWITLDAVERFDRAIGEPMARISMPGPGTVSIVIADIDESIAPPAPVVGSAILGAPSPQDFPQLEADLVLDPPVVPPTGKATAHVVARSIDRTTAWPSGLAVELYLEEKLQLADGSQLLEAPFSADLLLYHPRLTPEELGSNTEASAGALDFIVSPSERAAAVMLESGFEDIRLFPWSNSLERGQVLGPFGGTITSPDGIKLDIPEGALIEKTAISVTQLNESDLNALPSIQGFDTLAAIRIDLQAQELKRDATLSLNTPEATLNEDTQLILAEMISNAPDNRADYARLAARITRLSDTERIEAAPEPGTSPLALEGLRSEGLYLVLRAQAEVAYATGFVRAENDFAISGARVTAEGLGTADISVVGGRYTTPVLTAIDPAVTTLTAHHPSLDERGTTSLSAISEEIVETDITIEPVPPSIDHVVPASGATEVVVGSLVEIFFTEALDPVSVSANSISLEIATYQGPGTGAFIQGVTTLSTDGAQLIFTPVFALPAGRTFIAHFAGGVHDLGGVAYRDGPFDWSFTSSDNLAPGGQVHPELFHIRLPIDGIAQIYGDPGAVPIGEIGHEWVVSPIVASDPAAVPVNTYTVDTVGGFSGQIGFPPDYPVTINSEVWVRVYDPDGNLAETIRLGPFTTADGNGFVAPAGEPVSFTTSEGIVVDVPEGAFDDATVVSVSTLDPQTLGVTDDLGLGLAEYIRLSFDGEANESLILKIPAPADVPDGALVLLGEPMSTAWGRRLRLIGVGGVLVDGDDRYLSNDPSVQPSIPDLAGGAKAEGGVPDGVFIAMQNSTDVGFFYPSGVDVGLMSFSVDNLSGAEHEVYYNAQYPAWVYQGDAENWSAQVVLPVVEGSDVVIHRRDIATGWIISTQDYGTVNPTASGGIAALIAMQGPDPGPPRLLDIYPFEVIRFQPVAEGESETLRLDLEVEGQSSTSFALSNTEGFEMEQDAGLGVYQIKTHYETSAEGEEEISNVEYLTKLNPAFICQGQSLDQSFSVGSDELASAEFLAVITPGELNPTSLGAIRFTFNRSVDTEPEDIEDLDFLVSLHDVGPVGCESSAEERQVALLVETGYDGHQLVIRPQGMLSAGRHFRLDLDASVLFDDCEGQTGVCGAPRRYFFSTSEISDDAVGSGGAPGVNNAITMAKIGNLVFVGTLDGRVLVTDLSGGENSQIGVFADHAERNGDAARSVRAFATDGHGRLFMNMLYGGYWTIKALAVEDVFEPDENGNFDLKPGSVSIAVRSGTDLGTFLGLAGQLPMGTPVDLDIAINDWTSEAEELEAFCTTRGCEEQLGNPPDDRGFYSLEFTSDDIEGFEDLQEPISREDLCDWQENIDKYQRITLDNLTTGQSWSVDRLTPAWGGGSTSRTLQFKARRGDRLQVRYNLQTLGFVSIIGSGITVIDLNRFYNTVPGRTLREASQCGRRLGINEGEGFWTSPGCASIGLEGIAMTTSLAVAGSSRTFNSDETTSGSSGRFDIFSPLSQRGLVHSKSRPSTPGDLDQQGFSCLQGVSGLPRIRLRDVEIARDVTWIDRGLKAENPGAPFHAVNDELNQHPGLKTGDLLFVSLGEAGVYVYDITDRHLSLIGRFWVKDHHAYKLQVVKDLGVLLVGGLGGQLDIWDLANVNLAPGSDLGSGVLAPIPMPIAELDNVPWQTDRLAIDMSGGGSAVTWFGGDAGAVAFPVNTARPIFSGIFRTEDEVEEGVPIPMESRPESQFVPLGIPTQYSAALQSSQKQEDEEKYTAAFKVRVSLPGSIGPVVVAKVESLSMLPSFEQIDTEDLGLARFADFGAGWPESAVDIVLHRLGEEDPNMNGRFGTPYNLYESKEIVLLIADPRASKEGGYTPQGTGQDPLIHTEAGQCRRCERPKYLDGEKDVIELLAAGPYLRVRLDVEAHPGIEDLIEIAATAEVLGWVGDIPSPEQVSLSEPVLSAAMWSEGEAGIAVSLLSGESIFQTTDHAVEGRSTGFAFTRSYRSGMMTFNPLGKAGWTANYFAHLRENPITHEVEFHAGSGAVYRFYPKKAAGALEMPSGEKEGEFWAVASSYNDPDSDVCSGGEYFGPKGLYLTLRRYGEGWKIIGPHNETLRFDKNGRLRSIMDRFNRNPGQDPTEIFGKAVALHYDIFGRLNKVYDDFGRPYTFKYNEARSDYGEPGPKFGLLEGIKDFADREIQYAYNTSENGQRVLDKVTLPKVEAQALHGSPGEAVITYTYSYDTTDYGPQSILHGIFAGSRLKTYKLPGRENPRATITYKADSGKVTKIEYPVTTNFWQLDWSENATTRIVEKVDITAPWGLQTEYALKSSGLDRGRLDKITARAVPTLTQGGEQPQDLDLITDFTYTGDGSGRIEKIVNPDGSEQVFAYVDGSGLTEGIVETTQVHAGSAGSGTAAYNVVSSTLNFEEGADADNLPVSYTDAEQHEHKAGNPKIVKNAPQNAVSGHSAEGVFTTTEFDTSGRVTSENIGQGETAEKSESTAPVKTIYTYSEDDPPTARHKGLLEKVSTGSETGFSTEFEYNDQDTVETVRSKDGETELSWSTITRDSWDRPYKVESGQGGTRRQPSVQIETMKYDLSGLLRERTWLQGEDQDPVTETFEYDARENITKEILSGVAPAQPGGAFVTTTTTYTYDRPDGLLSSVQSPAGLTTTYGYDIAGRVNTITKPGNSGSINQAYDAMGRLVYTTDGDDGFWRGYYDAWGRLYKERFADGTDVERSFDKNGHLKSEKRLGPAEEGAEAPVLSQVDFSSTSYGAAKSTTEHIGSLDRTTRIARDALGREGLRQLETPSGTRLLQTTTYLQDGSGRVAAITGAEDNTITYKYTGEDQQPSSVIIDGVSHELSYDAQGRLVSTKQAGGWTSIQTFDRVGNVIEFGLESQKTKATYDSRGNVLSTTTPAGGETRFGYDFDGRLRHKEIKRHNGNWERTSYAYDPAGRLQTITRPGSPEEKLSYNSDDTIDVIETSIRNSLGAPLKLKHEYDSMGRLTRRYILNPEDFEGEVEGLADLKTFGEVFAYDRLGRLLSKDEIASFAEYDENGEELEPEQYDTSGSVTYTYIVGDPRTMPFSTQTSELPTIVQTTFDIYDDLAEITAVHNGRQMNHDLDYDDLGRRSNITRNGNSTTYNWEGFNRLGNFDTGSGGLAVTRQFGGLKKLSEQTYALNGTSAGGFGFDHDSETGWKNARTTGANAGLGRSMDWRWLPNPADRLESAKSSREDWTFGVEIADELSLISGPGGARNLTSGVLGRPESVMGWEGAEGITYDGRGFRSTDGENHYRWTWSGQLAEAETIEGQNTVSYSYDATGKLIRRMLTNADGAFVEAQSFLWNGMELLRQDGLNGEGTTLWNVEHLSGPGGLDDSPQFIVTSHLNEEGVSPVTRTFEILRDEMGSVFAVAERDSESPEPKIKARIFYSPYGEAYIDEGPELVGATHDLNRTEVEGVNQSEVTYEDIDGDEIPEEPTGVPGAMVFEFTMDLDATSLGAGVEVERRTDDGWQGVNQDFVIATDSENPARLIVMPYAPWQHAEEYKVTLFRLIRDTLDRAAVFHDRGPTYTALIEVDEILPEVPQSFAGFPVEYPLEYNTRKVAQARLDCGTNAYGIEPCFPGGLNFLFQGLYTDPATGISYARNRWYDPRTAHWLQPDPMGAFDSENHYAFVAWAPNMGRDPTGEFLVSGPLAVAGYMALSGTVSVGIGWGINELVSPEQEYTGVDTGIDFALGAGTFGLGHLSKLRYVARLGRAGRIGVRAGAEAGLDFGAEWARHELTGRDYTFGQLATGSVFNFGIGEGGALAVRGLGRFRNIVSGRLRFYSNQAGVGFGGMSSGKPLGRGGGLRSHPADPNVKGGSTNYRGRYQAGAGAEGIPRLPSDWNVHHMNPQHLARQGHPLVQGVDIHHPTALRGVPGHDQPRTLLVARDIGRGRFSLRYTNPHKEIDVEMAEFLRRNPTPQEWAEFKRYIDWRWGFTYWENRFR